MAHPDKKLPKLNTAAQNIQTEIRSSTKKPQKTNQMNINGRSIFAFILIFLIAFITLNATISQIRENVKIDDTSAGITETESIPESEITTYAEINGIKMEDDGTYTVKIDDTSAGITETESIPESEITMYVEINGIKMEDGGTYTVNPGDVIEVEASSINARIAFVGYYWDSKEDKIKDEYSNHLTITVPDNESGTKKTLFIEAVAANNDGDKNPETRTGWQKYYLVYEDPIVTDKALSVRVNNVEVTAGTPVKVEAGAEIWVYITPKEHVETLFYRINENELQSLSAAEARFTLAESAEIGSENALVINALFDDGLYIDGNTEEKTSSFIYYFEVIE